MEHRSERLYRPGRCLGVVDEIRRGLPVIESGTMQVPRDVEGAVLMAYPDADHIVPIVRFLHMIFEDNVLPRTVR